MKISIGKAAQELGVTRETLRRWELLGKIAVEYTPQGHRRYDLSQLRKLIPLKLPLEKKTIAYARVSSHDQKEDLKRQAMLLESFCASHGWSHEEYFGWRFAMFLPGITCILAGLLLMNRLRDTPQSLGLPPIERYRQDFPDKQVDHEEERELSTREILFEHVLKNPFIWILAASYFFVYLIRQAVNDWTVLYLVEAKSYSQLGASGVVMWFEVGGFFGSLVAGFASDTLFQGKRGPVNVLFCFLVCFILAIFGWLQASSLFVDSIILFAIGFFIFGPQMLIGMAAAELSHKKAAATATGFTGWMAYLGAATAGYPLGIITQNFGWDGFFITLTLCGALSTLLLLPLWSIKSRAEQAVKPLYQNDKTEESITCASITT